MLRCQCETRSVLTLLDVTTGVSGDDRPCWSNLPRSSRLGLCVGKGRSGTRGVESTSGVTVYDLGLLFTS